MSQITHGMNVEEVRRLGADLRMLGDRLDEMAKRLENGVGGVTWVGPDSARFKQQWWPQHRAHLQAVANDLRGFGDSAKNNADEQERTSTPSGGSNGGAPAPGGPGGPVTGAPPVGGTPTLNWGQRLSWEDAHSIADKYIPPEERTAYDFNGAKDGAGDWYQCTAWARARWRQMAEQAGVKLPPWNGHGGEVASNINRLLGRGDSSAPTVGAIVSMPGHVAVVEEIRVVNGVTQFRVSEMNTGYIDGKYANDADLAVPQEFSDARWFSIGDRPFTFAPFPG